MEKAEVRHMPAVEGSVKVLNKKQKKHLQESLEDMEKEDCALWSTLSKENKRPLKMPPKGCKTFLMELFAEANLSYMAVHMGFAISAPIDIIYDSRYDPFLLSMSPVCGPWSSWQNVNISKSEELYENGGPQELVPCAQVACWKDTQTDPEGQRDRAGNPWPSLLWKLRFMEDLYTEPLIHPVTGELVELCRLDQCMYGLEGESGLPHQKATGMPLSSGKMKKYLTTRCDKSHEHEPLEGGQRTKRVRQWPDDLCFAIMYGAQEELRKQVLKVDFSMEYEQEEREEQGPLDASNKMDDVSEMPWKRRRIDLHELDTEEDYDDHMLDKEDELVAQKERDRRQGWLQITKDHLWPWDRHNHHQDSNKHLNLLY